MHNYPHFLKHPPGIRLFLLIFLCFDAISGIKCQCVNEITVASGTEHFSCADVTVTSAGSVDYMTFCNGIGPYWIGVDDSGSYTFTFSTPVTGVTLDFNGFDNHDLEIEEVIILINGSPYIITDAGGPSVCNDLQAIATPWGTLMCPWCSDPNGCFASCEGVQINQTITSISIRDRHISGSPRGVIFSIFFCCGQCIIDAGVITSNPIKLCPGNNAIVPAANNTFLPPGALLQYILFSDLNDTLGSILASSNTPNFAFDPATMQEGTSYYVASIAGDELNGSVDLSSFCLDISNAIEVIWWPRPAVAFSVDNTNICVGSCTSVTATFNGQPPFTLTYTSTVTGPITSMFQDNFGIFEICTPTNLSPGNLLLQATALTDANCSCN